MASEFDLIAQCFAPLAGPEGLGLKDDAALFLPSPKTELIYTVDAMSAGVHFLPDEDPGVIAQRLMRVNVSDLSAKGAKPRGYLLTIALPRELDIEWVQAFAEGLAKDQDEFGIKVIGGDTVSTDGPLVLSLTAIGEAPLGGMVRRAGAKTGNDLYVTGTIGDAAFGLEVARGGLATLPDADRAYLEDRYRKPQPRLKYGQMLSAENIATAAADVSDGLLADAGHIGIASGVDIEISARSVPLSEAAQKIVDAENRLADAITGGDDYELVFTAPSNRRRIIEKVSEKQGLRVTQIGRIVEMRGEASAVRLIGVDGSPITLKQLGYRHR
jgi:thiamine-monophosphate kinase